MKNWHSWFSLLKWTRGRTAARARPRAPSSHYLLLSIPYEKLAFVVLPTQMDAWQNCRAGAPTRSIPAQPSPPSSLFPTFFSFWWKSSAGCIYYASLHLRCRVYGAVSSVHDNRICPSAESHAGGFFSPRFGQASTVAYLPYCEAWPGLKKPQ